MKRKSNVVICYSLATVSFFILGVIGVIKNETYILDFILAAALLALNILYVKNADKKNC